jgi:hypothetical protein
MFVCCFIAITIATGFCESQLVVAVKKAMDNDYAAEQVLGNFNGIGYGVRDLGTDATGSWSSHGFFNFAVDPDPNWSMSFTTLFNDAGGPTTLDSNYNGAFSMQPTGNMEMTTDLSSQLLLGQLSEDRDYLLIQYDTDTRETDDNRLRLFVATREGMGPYDNSVLNGSYTLRMMMLSGFHNISKNALISWGTLTFDGQSAYQFEYSNLDNTGESDTGTLTGTYLVDSIGRVSLSDDQGLSFLEGYLSSEGNVFILTNVEYTFEGNINILLFGMQGADENNPYTVESLTGDYSYAGLWVDQLTAESTADQMGEYSYGTINFDGLGGFTAEDNVFTSGRDAQINTYEGTYTITAEGEILLITTTMNSQALQQYRYQTGHLSNDGQLLVFNSVTEDSLDGSNDETTDTATDTNNDDGKRPHTGSESGNDDDDDDGNSGGCFINSLQ